MNSDVQDTERFYENVNKKEQRNKGPNSQSHQIRHHRQNRLVALQRQAQLDHIPLNRQPPKLLFPRRQPGPIADVHVALNLVNNGGAVLEQRRSASRQVCRERGRVVLQDVEHAVERVDLGQGRVEFRPGFAHFADKEAELRAGFDDRVARCEAACADGSGGGEEVRNCVGLARGDRHIAIIFLRKEENERVYFLHEVHICNFAIPKQLFPILAVFG